MKAHLMHPGRSFLPPTEASADDFARIAGDLEIGVLLRAASAGDPFLFDVMSNALADAWTNDLATILHRQAALKDSLANPEILRRLYALALEPFTREQSWTFGLYASSPSSKVGSSVRMLQGALKVLRRLRDTGVAAAPRFSSSGFQGLFRTLERDLDDHYLEAAEADLDNLTFRNGVLLSAQVGDGGKGVGTMLREPQPRDLSRLLRLVTPGPERYTFKLHPRDEAGARALGKIRDGGLSRISDALYQSAEHVKGFLKTLRVELAFYVGCLNLAEELGRVGAATVFPAPCAEAGGFVSCDLRDPSLALTLKGPVVGSDIDANGRPLVMVTGANRGGKSTFLRSVGLAQLMMQSGLFVTAGALTSPLRSGLFTHFKREEDKGMVSGKFDEELARMDLMTDRIHRGALVLFNESFAATNEREGAEVARQIVTALLENDVTVVFVTHMYELARAYLDDGRALFMRSNRGADGARSFYLTEARPVSSSFGADLFDAIFERPVGESDVRTRICP